LAIKDILFHLRTGAGAQSVIDFAVSLAASTGANLTAAGVAVEFPPPTMDEGTFGAVWDTGIAEAYAALTEYSRKSTDENYRKLVAMLPPHVSTEFMMIQTFPQTAGDKFGQLARRFDISIVSSETVQDAEWERNVVAGALFASGRPVFVIPTTYKGPAKLQKAIVCWDGGLQAARALAESVPLLTQVDSVEIIQVRCVDQVAEGPAPSEICQHLARHGISAEVRETGEERDAANAILSCAKESSADFIVMGAYGHWRLRELIFGGTTRTILTSTTIPAFMAH